MPGNRKSAVLAAGVEASILLLRGQRVMLSSTLARLYGVEPRALVQAVKRNPSRFPADFMFPLTAEEVTSLKSQFVISSWGGARRGALYAFTEQGVAMLSSVLRSEQAIQINVAIMRAFVRLREALATHKELAGNLAELERKIARHDESIQTRFEAIHRLTRTLPRFRCNVRPAGFDAPRMTGACSGLTFRRVKGLTLSKLPRAAPKLWRQKPLPPKHILHRSLSCDAICGLMTPPEPSRRRIGYDVRERRAAYTVPRPRSSRPA